MLSKLATVDSLESKTCNQHNHIDQYDCGSNNEIDRIP